MISDVSASIACRCTKCDLQTTILWTLRVEVQLEGRIGAQLGISVSWSMHEQSGIVAPYVPGEFERDLGVPITQCTLPERVL